MYLKTININKSNISTKSSPMLSPKVKSPPKNSLKPSSKKSSGLATEEGSRPALLRELPRPTLKISYKNYQQTEARFYQVICNKTSERCFSVTVKELCKEAYATKSTFYAHFQNVTAVRDSFETKLERDLAQLIPISANSSYVLEILTIYIAKNRRYFLATHCSGDRYLLAKIFRRYRYRLVDKCVDDMDFYLYSLNLQTVISCWLEFGGIDQAGALEVAKQLKRIKVPRPGRGNMMACVV